MYSNSNQSSACASLSARKLSNRRRKNSSKNKNFKPAYRKIRSKASSRADQSLNSSAASKNSEISQNFTPVSTNISAATGQSQPETGVTFSGEQVVSREARESKNSKISAITTHISDLSEVSNISELSQMKITDFTVSDLRKVIKKVLQHKQKINPHQLIYWRRFCEIKSFNK